MSHLPYFFSVKTFTNQISKKINETVNAKIKAKFENSSSSQISLWEAFFSSLVVGFAETYFQAFSIHMGCTTLQSGLLASFPLFVAIAYKFYDVLWAEHKVVVSRWMLQSILIQSSALLALAGLSLFSDISVGTSFWILFSIYSLYWVGHFRIQPAWNRWISEIIQVKDSQAFFSKRTRVVQLGTIIGLFFGGFALNLHSFNIKAQYLFFILFAGSLGFKLVTYFLYKRIPCPKFYVHTTKEKLFNFFHKHSDFFQSYGLFNLSLYLSAPFVAGYLLTRKNLTYETYMWVTLGAFVGKILTSMLLANYKKTFTPHQLLFYGALVAAPLPALWPLCQSMTAMFLLNLLSGMAWACWEIGISLSFFKNVKSHNKIEAVSVYNSIGISTQVAGAALGALLVKYGFHRNYDLLFVVAGLIRLFCAYGLRKRILHDQSQEVLDGITTDQNSITKNKAS